MLIEFRHRLVPRARCVLALSAVCVLVAGAGARDTAAATTPTPTPLFHLSAITSTPLPAQSATRFQVSASGFPAGNAPVFTWTLTLTGPVAARRCDDEPAADGQQVAADTYRWTSQGATFVWYHGSPGSYAGDRAYGCSPSEIGRDGYPGRVAVVAENADATCSAQLLAAVPRSGATEVGPDAGCVAGGYTLPRGLVPVPAALLSRTRALSAQLAALIAAVRAGSLTNVTAYDRAAASFRSRAQTVYAQLFPPVWGCRFATLLGDAVAARTAIDGEATAAGDDTTAATLGRGVSALRALGAEVASCSVSSGGAPRSVLAVLDALASSAAQPGALAVTARTLAAILLRDVPPVYGMAFATLVGRELSEDAALDRARNELRAGVPVGAAVTLQGALGSERALERSLQHQAHHVAAVANAHS